MTVTILRGLPWSERSVSVACVGRQFWASFSCLNNDYGADLAPALAGDAAPEKSEEALPEYVGEELTPENVGYKNYYELLGVGTTGDGISARQIKAAYRRQILKYHPDKTGRGDQDIVFISIQKAYAALSDSKLKRAYDSNLDFDDSIPGAAEGQGDAFYGTYAPVFARNKRFAVKTPVPDLGGPDATEDEVERFYQYWHRFESWRDFTIEAQELAEMDIEDATCREEKRWMQKEVSKKARVLKRKELARIQTLVERAQAADPRAIRFKAAKKARREASKRAKAEHRRLLEEQKRLAAERELAEAAAREEALKEEAKQARFDREQLKKRLRKRRNTARRLLLAAQSALSAHPPAAGGESNGGLRGQRESDLDEALKAFGEQHGPEALEAMAERMGGEEGSVDVAAAEAAWTELTGFLSTAQRQEEEERRQRELKLRREAEQRRAEAERRRSQQKAFSDADVAMLSKAIKRFPAGTGNRWETIAHFMNQQLAPEVPFTKEDCLAANQRVKLGATRAVGKGSAAAAAAAPPPTGAKANAEGASKGAASSAAPSAASSASAWTQEQQKQLEEGLKTYPSSMDKNERWKAIAANVAGKTKKECVARYKELRAGLKAKKGE